MRARTSAVALEVAQDRRCCRRQSQTPDAPILGIGAALDQALRLQAVNQASDRDRSDLGNGGELVLGHAWLALQPR
jgi:hypothetical protein